MKRLLALLLTILMVSLLLGGCGDNTQTIAVAEQFGTAYTPIALMREAGILERHLPDGVVIQWNQLANTATIRESMLAGKTDVACMAIPPFLIGRDAGMEWRICGGVSQVPMGLVTRDDSLQSIADIGPGQRIALPQPGSIQHILLAMAAERELGEAGRFDNQLVTMAHPDGMSALLSGGEVSLHFTTSPYLQQELAAGMSLLLTGEEAMGGSYTGIVAVSTQTFQQQQPELYQAFLAALEEAIALLTDDPEGCAQLLAPVYGMEPEELLAQFQSEGTAYTLEVDGVEAFSAFMVETGYLSQSHPLEELLFEEVFSR